MNRIGKSRIGTGWMQVSSETGSTVAWSLQLLAGAGVTALGLTAAGATPGLVFLAH